jgi:hypothetical protein
MRLAAIGYILGVSACGAPAAPVIAPVPSTTRAVYEAVVAYALRTDHLLVARTTLPLPPMFASPSFTRGEPAGADLQAMGLRLPFDAGWVPAPPIESDSASAAYFGRLRPFAEVSALSEIWWSPDRTAAVVEVSRIRCTRCGYGASVLRVELHGAQWVVQPDGITIRE